MELINMKFEKYEIEKDGFTYEIYIKTNDENVTSKIMALQDNNTKCATFGRYDMKFKRS